VYPMWVGVPGQRESVSLPDLQGGTMIWLVLILSAGIVALWIRYESMISSLTVAEWEYRDAIQNAIRHIKDGHPERAEVLLAKVQFRTRDK
jgi:hypothetical protein